MLPKTLDETYERIFLSIPREAWSAVHHMFQWMWYHNELHIHKLTCAILLDAIQYILLSTKDPMADMNHNVGHLRELCGCLIRIEDDKISFAHYTVLEYLRSDRITNSATSFFTINPERVVLAYVPLTINRVQAELLHWTMPPNLAEDDKLWSNTDPVSYHATSVLLSIVTWAEEISRQDSIVALVVGFLDPTNNHFKLLGYAANIGLRAGKIGFLACTGSRFPNILMLLC
jgi:hypothetical protein